MPKDLFEEAGVQPPSKLDRFGTGLLDPVFGAGQLAEDILPNTTGAIGMLNNYLVDEGVPLARVPEGGLNQMAKDREASLPKEDGTDWYRTAGDIVSPVNAATKTEVMLDNVVSKLLSSAATGGLFSGVQPATEWNDLTLEKIGQIGLGGLLGGIGAKAEDKLSGLEGRLASRYSSAQNIGQ